MDAAAMGTDWFRYGSTELTAIVTEGGRSLTDRARSRLEYEANVYQGYRNSDYVPEKKKALAWEKAANLARQLNKALEDAASISGPRGFLAIAYSIKSDLWDHMQFGPNNGTIADMLAACERFARLEANYCLMPHAHTIYSRRERDWPRIRYYREVLSVWTSLGGTLRTSRSQDPDSKAYIRGGPAVRFVQAVTGPVMCNDAPSLEGIRDIIEREKEMRKIDLKLASESSRVNIAVWRRTGPILD